jgi:hypothetical protein
MKLKRKGQLKKTKSIGLTDQTCNSGHEMGKPNTKKIQSSL